MLRFLFAAAALLFLAAFDFVPPHKDLAAPAPPFRPEEFFLGRTQGKGTIKAALSRRSALAVEGVGHLAADGTFVLDQKVQREGHALERRQWRIRRLRDGRYAGTLSDASGPVVGEVQGNCLRFRYKTKSGGMQVEQFVYLQPGGRVALNRMTVRKLGMTFATVEETIRKVD